MAITHDATTTAAYDSDAQQTIAHTTTTSLNRIMVVGVTVDSDDIVSQIAYNGTNLTQGGEINVSGDGTHYSVEIWYLVDPSTGNNNLTVTLSDSDDFGVAIATYYDTANSTWTKDLDDIYGAGPTQTVQLSFTTGGDNALIVAMTGDSEDAADFRTAEANTNERADFITGEGAGDFGGWLGDKVLPSTGATTIGYTTGGDVTYSGVVVSFVPSGGAVSTAVSDLISPGIIASPR